MSNMIKAYTVRYDEVITKTIDTHLKAEKELEIKRSKVFKTIVSQDQFVEGLKAFVVDELPSQVEMTEKTSAVLEEANNEAKNILENEKLEAEKIKKDIMVSAQKKGYDNGMLMVKHEAIKLKADYEEKEQILQKQYEELTLSMEPQMAVIIASLVEKITGILVEDKEEVILYLVNKALKNMDKSNEYTIKVSREDYEYIAMRKNILLSAIGREVSLYIDEDLNLKKNQCRIETELRVIDCSLDIQLNNLITDLKLIGGI